LAFKASGSIPSNILSAHHFVHLILHRLLSVNLSGPGSDLRIQLQTDPRYQDFISRAESRTVLGYPLKVASVEDVLQGKLWAYQDESRRSSKRQKDLADVARLVEARPELEARLPAAVRDRLA
jgi:hypothetical protein